MSAGEAAKNSISPPDGMSVKEPETVVTGAQALIRCLQAEGVEVIFGYPGGAVLPIYDEIYKSSLRHVLTRHEQAAAHAADAYARVTGRPGVCIATSGPGATNLVTGLATAYMDSIPVVAITGQVPTSLIGKDAFQEADITGITLPITKHNYLVKNAADLPRVIREAFHIAASGRPGPVLIDLPKDVTTARFRFYYPEEVDLPSYKPTYIGHAKQIRSAVEAIRQAERPVLYVGGGAVRSGAHREIRQLAEKMEIPVTMTLMGLGAFPGEHRLSLGMLGMHGTAYANYAVSECDLLIAVGARFDDRVTGAIERFAPRARIIHIDIDPAEVGKNVQVDIPIVGDARSILQEVLARSDSQTHPAWMKQIEEWKQRFPLKYDTGARDSVPASDFSAARQAVCSQCTKRCRWPNDDLAPQEVISTLYQLTGGKAIITTEVGQHQMWAAQFYKFSEPRRFVTSGGLGTMGFGFPAAIGAQVGRPGETVVCVAGDGSFQMNVQELATVAQEQLPVKIIIINNGFLGMVRQWQELFFEKRYSHTCLDGTPDFCKLADAYGIKAMRVSEPQELRSTLLAALQYKGPVLVDCRVRRTENVFPMVPAGGALDEMLGIEEG